MKRIVGSYGTVLVDLISSTKDRSRITLGLLERAILLTLLLKVLKMKRNASPDPKMNLLVRVREEILKVFFRFSA